MKALVALSLMASGMIAVVPFAPASAQIAVPGRPILTPTRFGVPPRLRPPAPVSRS